MAMPSEQQQLCYNLRGVVFVEANETLNFIGDLPRFL
jgi:hypothetical protein